MGKLKMSLTDCFKRFFIKDKSDYNVESQNDETYTVEYNFPSVLTQQYNRHVYEPNQEYTDIVSALIKRDDAEFIEYSENQLRVKCRQYIFEFYIGNVDTGIVDKARLYLGQCTIERLNVNLSYENLKDRFVNYSGKLPLETMIEIYNRFEKPNKRKDNRLNIRNQIISDLKV